MFKVEKIVLLVLAGLLLITAGCGDWCKKEPAAMKPAAEPVINPCAAPAMTQITQAYPVGGPMGNAVRLEKMVPAEVRANEPFEYRIKVTNLTDASLRNVVVSDRISENLTIKTSTPQASAVKEGTANWVIGDLGPNASEIITASCVATGKGTISSCAEVTYDTPMCAMVNIVEPALRLTKIAPAETLVCERIPFDYVITNTGTGYACNVTIEEPLHEQLMTSDGQHRVMFTIDSLGPGESREFKTMLDATAAGTYSSKAVAKSASAGTVESNTTTTAVKQPLLKIDEAGPNSQFIGRSFTYEITVTNTGNGIAKDTIVETMVPENIDFESATLGGKFSRSSPGKVLWNLGTLEPNTSKKLSVTLIGQQVGSVETTTMAKAYCADTVSAAAKTILSGIPGILLEVIDVSDPIEIGKDETYIITVTNQGSAADTNIRISCTLEDTMRYVLASGPTNASVEGNTITFAPLSSLAPQAQAQWKVNVKAASQGDTRFKTSMTSDQLTRSVDETEATRFYK